MRAELAAVLALGAFACAAPKTRPSGEPRLASEELTVDQGLTDFRVRLKAQVQSPVEATVEKATYELVVDGKVVKSGEEPLGVRIPPGESASVHLEAGSRYVASAEELLALSARGGSFLTAMRGKLTVRREGQASELEYARSREIRVPRLPVVKLHEVDAARYSADEVNALFYLGVENPNPFPVKLSALSYAVAIAGKKLAEGDIGRGEKVGSASTGVFEVQVSVNKETYGAEVAKLIKTLSLPYQVTGELTGDLFRQPYELTGDIKLNVSGK